MIIRQAISPGLKIFLAFASLLAFLAFWQLLVVMRWVAPLFLPTPLEVLYAARRLYGHENFLSDLVISIFRVGIGFLLAAAIGIPLGVLMGSWAVVRGFFEPGLAFVRYMPATAFVPLLVLWLGIDEQQKFAVVFIGAFFHLTLMVMHSVQNVPMAFIESARLLGAGRYKTLIRVIWPAARPAIWDNLRIVLGWAWTYIIVAELVAANSGIGFVILRASRYMDVATIFVGIISIGMVGVLSDLLFSTLSRLLFPYHNNQRK